MEKADLLKALPQNDFRKCFQVRKAPVKRCVASNGNYFERDNMQKKIISFKILFETSFAI
jgi:hypothetical protein